MTEHYTKNTESVTHWCNRCGRPTDHKVSAGRLGRCMEHESKVPRAKIPKLKLPAEPQQGELFPQRHGRDAG